MQGGGPQLKPGVGLPGGILLHRRGFDKEPEFFQVVFPVLLHSLVDPVGEASCPPV